MSTHHTPRHRSAGRTGFGRSPWPPRPIPVIPSPRRALDDLEQVVLPAPRRPVDDGRVDGSWFDAATVRGPVPAAARLSVVRPGVPAVARMPRPPAPTGGARSRNPRPSARPRRPAGPRWLAPATALLLAGVLVGAAVAVGVLGAVGVPDLSGGAARFAGAVAPTSIAKI